MFHKDVDFEAFERVMVERREGQSIRVLSYCVMSIHWHFVVWPGRKDTHTMIRSTWNGEPDPKGGAAQRIGLVRRFGEVTERSAPPLPPRGPGSAAGSRSHC